MASKFRIMNFYLSFSFFLNILYLSFIAGQDDDDYNRLRRLPVKDCPTSTFMFTNQWVAGSPFVTDCAYTTLAVGDDLGGDIRICKFQTDGAMGFESYDNSGYTAQYVCKNGSLRNGTEWENFPTYSVLVVPKLMSVVWIQQQNLQWFGDKAPKPLTVADGPGGIGTKWIVGRCRKEFTPFGYVINIPGYMTNISSSLWIQYNGKKEKCDDRYVEIPVCV